ncbi:hypothetical protein AS033_15575 [Exiguobacterium indicum]|uniref:Uncharacterized protein n=1 Tax=Exiguobacterium indicum TaxID=296995 RepID=A0A0V8GBN2_9BACL|nr:hypothetical protein AS033_15575 [Exiguobacterium enclense]
MSLFLRVRWIRLRISVNFVMYNSPEDESKDITWKVYNFEKNRLTEHRMMGKSPNQLGMTQIFNTDQRLY